MIVPTTTPGTHGRVRVWITKTPPSNERLITRRVVRGLLLAIAAVALTGAIASA